MQRRSMADADTYSNHMAYIANSDNIECDICLLCTTSTVPTSSFERSSLQRWIARKKTESLLCQEKEMSFVVGAMETEKIKQHRRPRRSWPQMVTLKTVLQEQAPSADDIQRSCSAS